MVLLPHLVAILCQKEKLQIIGGTIIVQPFMDLITCPSVQESNSLFVGGHVAHSSSTSLGDGREPNNSLLSVQINR